MRKTSVLSPGRREVYRWGKCSSQLQKSEKSRPKRNSAHPAPHAGSRTSPRSRGAARCFALTGTVFREFWPWQWEMKREYEMALQVYNVSILNTHDMQLKNSSNLKDGPAKWAVKYGHTRDGACPTRQRVLDALSTRHGKCTEHLGTAPSQLDGPEPSLVCEV